MRFIRLVVAVEGAERVAAVVVMKEAAAGVEEAVELVEVPREGP